MRREVEAVLSQGSMPLPKKCEECLDLCDTTMSVLRVPRRCGNDPDLVDLTLKAVFVKDQYDREIGEMDRFKLAPRVAESAVEKACRIGVLEKSLLHYLNTVGGLRSQPEDGAITAAAVSGCNESTAIL